MIALPVFQELSLCLEYNITLYFGLLTRGIEILILLQGHLFARETFRLLITQVNGKYCFFRVSGYISLHPQRA